MAHIRDTQSERTYPLRAHHTFGRCTEHSDTVVSNPVTSRIHMALEWDGLRWNVRDLSKNGTWLGESRLIANESTPLACGDKLHLGTPDMPPLELVDDSPPQSQLAGINNTESIPLEAFLFLPDQQSPEAAVIYSHSTRNWTLHPMDQDISHQADRVLHHGDRINCGGGEWQLFLAEASQVTEISTAPENTLDDVEFVFDLSQDEENTALQLRMANQQMDLGERSHHYLLLHLARVRAMEADRGFDNKAQGWIDNEQLKKDLGMEMPHINIMIFRARKQIAEKLADSLDSEHLVERGKGRMRFGGTRVRIYKGEQLTYALPASTAA